MIAMMLFTCNPLPKNVSQDKYLQTKKFLNSKQYGIQAILSSNDLDSKDINTLLPFSSFRMLNCLNILPSYLKKIDMSDRYVLLS